MVFTAIGTSTNIERELPPPSSQMWVTSFVWGTHRNVWREGGRKGRRRGRGEREGRRVNRVSEKREKKMVEGAREDMYV